VDSIDAFPNAKTEEKPQPVDQHNPATAPLVLTIEQAAERLGIGRSLMYALVMSAEIESVTIGRLRRVPTDALAAYITKLRQANRPGAVA
jgi:excisionase family DNA binding protein